MTTVTVAPISRVGEVAVGLFTCTTCCGAVVGVSAKYACDLSKAAIEKVIETKKMISRTLTISAASLPFADLDRYR
jgi:L-cystine uptake protein TcyP (sodium:dicarboxylate symporter family)